MMLHLQWVRSTVIFSVCFLFMVSCVDSINKQEEEKAVSSYNISTIDTLAEQKELEVNPFLVSSHPNKGIVLIDTLNIYDRYQNVLGIKTGLFNQIVTIDSVSKDKFPLDTTSDRCYLHNFVKIRIDNFSAWVYGESLFEYENQERDTTLSFDSVQFTIIPTKNFNVGVYDEMIDGLSFCGSGNHSPMVLYNNLFDKTEVVILESTNKNYLEKYVTLDSHDGWIDKITEAKFQQGKLTLSILREYQEGFSAIELIIDLDDLQSTGAVTMSDIYYNSMSHEEE